MIRIPIRLSFPFAAMLALALLPAPARPAHAADFTVTTEIDNLNCVPGNCSLRGAIIAATKSAGQHVIMLPAGTYTLSIPGEDGAMPADNNSVKGDLDIPTGAHISIIGDGPDKTIIDGNGGVTGDRVFDINEGATLEIGGVTLRNGKAGLGFQGHVHGGGIHNHGSLIMQNAVVADSSVVAENWGGGGITNAGNPTFATASLNNVTISGNKVLNLKGRGGGIENGGSLNLMNSTVSGNEAPNGGGISNFTGAIPNTNAFAGLNNVTISTNRAVGFGTPGLGTFFTGGGILNDNGGIVGMIHVTLASNTAANSGGNLAALKDGKTVSYRNTIFADGSPTDCYIDATTDYRSLGHNLSTDRYCELDGTGDRPDGELRLGPLADNGGKTLTRALLPPVRENGILYGNDAIDGCDQFTFETTDQRGMDRPADGDRDGTAICDIGAYELPRQTPSRQNENDTSDDDDDDDDDDD